MSRVRNNSRHPEEYDPDLGHDLWDVTQQSECDMSAYQGGDKCDVYPLIDRWSCQWLDTETYDATKLWCRYSVMLISRRPDPDGGPDLASRYNNYNGALLTEQRPSFLKTGRAALQKRANAVQPREVHELFVSHGFGIKNVDMSIDPFKHRNPSYCFVDLHTADDATRAMQNLQGLTIRERPVRIKPHTERSDRQNKPPTKSFDYGPHARIFPTRTDVPRKSSTFDRWSREDLQKTCDNATAEARRLFVGGMSRIPHPDVVDADIRDLFQGWEVLAVSKLISPRIHWTQEAPGSRHYCFVDFVSPQEARRAVANCDGQPTPQGGRYKIELAR
ncbi:hypothetical protein B0A48_06093 [Cryoendolithus antarcticus]|uniref:RRM domain-containing protein n=1 Tax=Cryoendolithus antarcticus TaxID=1507870 RepID=A0A1V8TDC4_9PEZI|nr:hypothetical protein B0A48_06093 [Cryoendolithus antarcticus]